MLRLFVLVRFLLGRKKVTQTHQDQPQAVRIVPDALSDVPPEVRGAVGTVQLLTYQEAARKREVLQGIAKQGLKDFGEFFLLSIQLKVIELAMNAIEPGATMRDVKDHEDARQCLVMAQDLWETKDMWLNETSER